MTNIHLIVQLGDGCVIAGTLVQFEQTVPMPPVVCSIPKLPEASCRVSVLTGTLGTLDFNARHVVKIGTDKDHMVEIKAATDGTPIRHSGTRMRMPTFPMTTIRNGGMISCAMTISRTR